MTTSKFFVTEYTLGKTTNGYDCYLPGKQVNFFTKEKAETYFEGYRFQKFMNVYEMYEVSNGSELCDIILTNLN